jgi:hypothetical protein
MQIRHNAGARPQLTFTSDFHELVQGDLVPGPCILRYDPLRLVTLGEAAAGRHEIRACVRFHPDGAEWQGKLELPAGLPLGDLADVCGQGFMLTATFDIPAGCDALEAWFSCIHDGQTRWDSDHGRNHWLRFGLADVSIQGARVIPAKDLANPQDTLDFELGTSPKVDSVTVRWRSTNLPGASRVETPLVCAAATPDGKIWTAPAGGIPAPRGAVVAFDVVYRVGGRSYTDDNQGRWYIAD